MAERTVPNSGSRLKHGTPGIDLLYGYNFKNTFPQKAHLILIVYLVVANKEGLQFLLFANEIKGDGGSMWVATNRCLITSVSCVKIVERLNDQLRFYKWNDTAPINSAAFRIATNGTEA